MKSTTLPIVLGSSSPARFELMSRLRLPFTTHHPNIDESHAANEPIEQIVKRLAYEKTIATATHHPQSLVIGCDQLVSIDNTPLGKPLTHKNAQEQLRASSGRILHSYTALCVLNSQSQTLQQAVIPYQVKFKTLDDDIIDRYLTLEQPYHCAGSIKAEALGICLFEWMKGDDPTALTGLPLITLTSMLSKAKNTPLLNLIPLKSPNSYT